MMNTMRTTRQLLKRSQISDLGEDIGKKTSDGADQGICSIQQRGNSSLPIVVVSKSRQLSPQDLQTLRRKEQWLKSYTPSFPHFTPRTKTHPDLSKTLSATLVFAQEEAGTAICISSDGLLLSCSHCVSENSKRWRLSRYKWLLFASGLIVRAECIAWDGVRDLALLKIIAIGSSSSGTSDAESQEPMSSETFPFVQVSETEAKIRQPLICIGHPGAEDLESVVPGTKTNYDVLYVSQGSFRGYAANQDIHDNSDIGALMHDCWTYWGHSGAPLIDVRSARLVGLHSSWDDSTGMRRGIGLEAIREFMRQQGISV